MIKFVDKCIICGSKKLTAKQGSISVTVGKDKTMNTQKIQYIECSVCGEKYTNLENEVKIAAPGKVNGKRVSGF